MKRFPRIFFEGEPNRFLRLSLRTDLPFDAVMRAGKLLSVYEQKEPEIVDALERKEISTEDAQALLNEMLRQALKRILNEQSADRGLSDCEIDGRIEMSDVSAYGSK